MSNWEITYQQTPTERYGTEVNAKIRDLISATTPIVGEFGGSGFSEDPNAMIADAGFEIDCDETQAEALRVAVEEWLATHTGVSRRVERHGWTA